MKTLADKIKDYDVSLLFDRGSVGRYLRGAALSLALVLSSPHILASSYLNPDRIVDYKSPLTQDTKEEKEESRKPYSGRKDDVFSLMDIVDDSLKADIIKEFKKINIHDFRNTSRRVNKYNPIINSFSDVYNVDADLVAAVIHQESSGNPRATSPKGATGLMQLMPNAVTERERVMNPRYNVDFGTRHLSRLIEMYDGNVVLGLAAYNTGHGRVNKILRRRDLKPENADWKRIRYSLGEETRDYIPRVFSRVLKMRESYMFGKDKRARVY